MNINKNILRSFLILSFILINVLIIFGISAVFTYLNTGADRSTMLHSEIKKADQYSPKMVWAPIENEGRQINPQTLSEIEKDYLDAWYVKHVANKTNSKEGIKDYFTENARENLYHYLDLNAKEDITIESTTLNHNPTLEFFSEDGQLAVLTDKEVKEFKRIYKNNELVFETKESSTFKVVLLLEDGFWRIRHLVKDKVTEGTSTNLNNAKTNNDLYDKIRGINYYPQSSPWNTFGAKFDLDVFNKDFKIIKEANLNAIRIFIQYEDFGKANVDQGKLKKLEQLLDAALNEDLKVIITLFDFYGDYSLLDWTLNQRHAEAIVSTFKEHQAILAWDIKNEPDLDFESRGKELILAWLKNMVELVKNIDQNHGVTIGWAKSKNAILLNEELDLVSFHYYEDINELEKVYQQMKIDIPNKPIMLGEYGISSYKGFWKPLGSSKAEQADFHKTMQHIFKRNNIQYMSWTLYDFIKIPKDVVGGLPWRKNVQKQFGFIDKNGQKKPSFDFISNE